MKYRANPVEVDAYKIVSVEKLADGRAVCRFELPPIGETLVGPALGIASPEMMSRMTPKEGDYWVVQADGYEYLNPRDVFERKYSPIP